jgi:putative membrane protein
LLPVFFPDLDHAPGEWRQVSRRAIRRGTTKGLVVCLAASTVFVVITRSWVGCWPLALTPIIYALNVLDYRHLGYWWNGAYFRSRRGWLRRATHIVPIRNAQSIVVRQTPFDRRHRVATLLVDTAGQAYTGGAPQVANVPAEEAMNFARILAHCAATTRYTLK